GACLAVAFAGALLSGGSSQADTVTPTPSFAEFEASTYVDVDGAYVVNGDEIVSSKDDLRAYYTRMIGQPGNHDRDTHDADLVVNTVGGADDKWDASTAADLTYCVSTDFGAKHADMVTAMEQGAGQWEAESSAIDFVHDSSQDGDCNTGNSSVLFSV